MTLNAVALEKALAFEFIDHALLVQALTHRSAGGRNNERLEFLGDAVLGSVIAIELFQRFPKAREGELSRYRAILVRRESLAELARSLDIGNYLHLGSGERKSGGFRRDSILADALEAVLGAIYLDQGFEACQRCILTLFSGKLAGLLDISELKDAKSRLQEYLQSRQRPLPEYSVVETTGEAHDQHFMVQCRVDHEADPADGSGKTRRQAEQGAAAKMLERISKT